MSQRSIPKGKVARAAAIAGVGVRVGANYARYHGGRLLRGGEGDRESLHEANARDTYQAFSRLKGGPLKVAQMLSIDQNLLPRAYTEQFAQAQYKAPPLSYPLVVQVFRREFGKAPEEIFDEFSREAVSGASIGQVHRARIGQRQYAVKVQYPGVADSLESDLALLQPVARRMFQLTSEQIAPFITEVKARLLEETDYCLELRRSVDLASRTSGAVPGVRFPGYHPELSSRRVLTMDWVDGVPLDVFARSGADPATRDRVGQGLWDFFHHQIHQLREFHADPHPGNFLVDASGDLWILDFGCVKMISEEFYRRYFRLLDTAVESDAGLLTDALADLELLLDGDGPRERELLLALYRESVEILARPFREPCFDFGDEAYFERIREFGERMNRDPELRRIGSGRGSPDALYLNRAYFGVYNLAAMLRARVRAEIPDFLRRAA